MKTTFLSFAILVFLFSGCAKSEKQSTTENLADTTAAQPEVVDLAILIANPTQYDGKEVAIQGTVVHVCKHSGKRLHLMGADETTKLRVEAGDIGQFAKELEGSDIIARGVFHVGASPQGEHTGENAASHDGKKMQGVGAGNGTMMQGEGEPGEMQSSYIAGISFETIAAE